MVSESGEVGGGVGSPMTIQIHPKETCDNETTKESPTGFVRVNGWTRPYHYFQVIGWILFITTGLVHFTLLVPNIENLTISLALLVFSLIIYLSHLIFHIIAATVNPLDVIVGEKYNDQLKPRKFERSLHLHVIENQFCYICESQVGPKSKHCSLCNKCVSNFDHHCKWLNNCVGGRNYRWFVLSMLTALIYALTILTVAIVHIVWLHSSDNSQGVPKAKLIVIQYELDNQGYVRILWATILYTVLLVSVIGTILLMHLCLFHLFLRVIGLTTYEFVMRQRAMIKENGTTQNAATTTDKQIEERNNQLNDGIRFFVNLKQNIESKFRTNKVVDNHDLPQHSSTNVAGEKSNQINFESVVVNYNKANELKI